MRPRSSLLVVGQVLIWQVCRCREIEPSSTRDSPPAGCYWHTHIHTHTHKQSSGPQEALHRQVAIDVFSTRPTQLLAVWQGWDQPESPERCTDTDMVTRALVFLFFQHAHPFFSTLCLLTRSTGRVALPLTSDQASLLAGELFYVLFFGGRKKQTTRSMLQFVYVVLACFDHIPSSLEKHACGGIAANKYYILCCTFHFRSKMSSVKCFFFF